MVKIFPTQEGLEVKEDTIYECIICHKTFPSKDVKYKKMPSSFNVVPLESESEIPQCPLCDSLAFFGFREV